MIQCQNISLNHEVKNEVSNIYYKELSVVCFDWKLVVWLYKHASCEVSDHTSSPLLWRKLKTEKREIIPKQSTLKRRENQDYPKDLEKFFEVAVNMTTESSLDPRKEHLLWDRKEIKDSKRISEAGIDRFVCFAFNLFNSFYCLDQLHAFFASQFTLVLILNQ
jgi:hypothetical protein